MKYALTCLIIIAGMSGCEKREGSRPAAPAANSGAASRSIRIVYIPKNSGNPYFDGVSAGIKKLCDERGIEYLTIAPASPDATSQIPFIKDQVQQGVAAIILSPNSVDALNGVLDDARARGIRIVTVDADLTGNESHRDAGVLPADFNTLGAWQIEFLGSLIDYEGKFAILSATTDAPNQNRWIADMKETLRAPRYARMELVEVVYGDDKPQKSRTEAEGLLTKHPDLRAIIAPTTVGIEQAAKAVETAGVYPGGPHAAGKGVVATGFGTPNQMRRYVTEGIVPAFALWVPADMGYISAFIAAELIDGKLQAQPGTSFDVPGIGTRQFGQGNVVITGPPMVFTKDNIDSYRF
jgi:rhamnose transport system substrate-binding protein